MTPEEERRHPSGRVRGRSAALAAALAVAAILGCAGAPAPPPAPSPPAENARRPAIPDYGKPRGRVLPPSELARGDLVSYRPVTRGDFLAADPPAALESHRAQLGAYTCGQIRPREGTRLRAKPARGDDGAMVFRAGPEPLEFRAYMDRSCSWWNDAMTALPTAYVLEHEQIHFALFELTARDMTARGAALAAEMEATAPTAQAALEASQARMSAVLQRELGAALREQTRFDEDTSFGFRPEAQARWRQRVEHALAQ